MTLPSPLPEALEIDPVEFARILRERLEKAGFGVRTLVKRCRSSPEHWLGERTLFDLKGGKRARIRTTTLLAICYGLDIPPETFATAIRTRRESISAPEARSEELDSSSLPSTAQPESPRPRGGRRALIAGVVAVGVVLTASLWMWRQPRASDPPPTHSLRRLEAVNQSRLALWEGDELLWNLDCSPDRVTAFAFAPWGGGEERVVVATAGEAGALPYLRAWSWESNRELWRSRIPWEEVQEAFGGAARTEGGAMWCHEIEFANLDGVGEEELVTLWHQATLYPACVRIADEGGTVRSTYWNPGYFDRMEIVDLDDDGKDEILAAGTNNAWGGASVALLDDVHCAGAAVDERGMPRSSLPDSARRRLLIPPHPRSVMTQSGLVRLHVRSISTVRDGEGRRRLQVNVGGAERYFNVLTDANLHPVWAIPSDGYGDEAKRWLEEGTIDVDITTREYVRSWLSASRIYSAGHDREEYDTGWQLP